MAIGQLNDYEFDCLTKNLSKLSRPVYVNPYNQHN